MSYVFVGDVPSHLVSFYSNKQDVREALEQFKQNHPKARLTKINGEVVRGLTFCGRPVLEGHRNTSYSPRHDRYACADCGCHWCKQRRIKP